MFTTPTMEVQYWHQMPFGKFTIPKLIKKQETSHCKDIETYETWIKKRVHGKSFSTKWKIKNFKEKVQVASFILGVSFSCLRGISVVKGLFLCWTKLINIYRTVAVGEKKEKLFHKKVVLQLGSKSLKNICIRVHFSVYSCKKGAARGVL